MNTKSFYTFLLLIANPFCIHSSEDYFKSQLIQTAHFRMQGGKHSNNLPMRQKNHIGVVTIHDVKRNDWNEEKDQLEKRCILLMLELISEKLDNVERELDSLPNEINSLINVERELNSPPNEIRSIREDFREEMRLSNERETLVQPLELKIEEKKPKKINPFYAIYITLLLVLAGYMGKFD